MIDPTRDAIDSELHRRLVAAAPTIDFPTTPDLAGQVRAAVAQEASTRAVSRHWPPSFAAVAAVALLVVVFVVLAIPASRASIAGWLGVPGIHIEFSNDDTTPTAPASPPASLGLLFGQPVTLAEARATVDFPVSIPDYPGLGQPDEVYVRARPGGDQVVFLYGARPNFPATAETGIGLMLIQFEAPADAFWGVKVVTGSTDVRVVRINGKEGVWIGGSHQLLIVPDPDPLRASGRPPDETALAARPSANVLLWANDYVTLRIESDLSRQKAIAFAESLVLPPNATPGP